MAYEQYKCEHNDCLVLYIYNEVVEDINNQFKELVKNVEHSKEYLITYEHVGLLLDMKIEYHRANTKYVHVDQKFMHKFVKDLKINYVLENEDNDSAPVACANINCQIRENNLIDYLDLEVF